MRAAELSRRRAIAREGKALLERLVALVDHLDRLAVIKAPPGSGKTFTLLYAVDHAFRRRLRVAVAAQTNAQCDDICRRLVADRPRRPVWRFAASGAEPTADLANQITWTSDKRELPTGPSIVVGTTAKWALVDVPLPYDYILVDEAWQMSWSDFMLLGQVPERFVLIGDPGQIPPVVPLEVHRWETSPRAPHRAAPEIILGDPAVASVPLELKACRRLPADSVDLVRPFYDFHFESWALPGERYVTRGRRRGGAHPVDPALDRLAESSAVVLTLPTPEGGPPLEYDAEVAAVAARVAVRALERGCAAAHDDGGDAKRLDASDIGISATHRVMNSAILQALPERLRDQSSRIRVDTPERWQGLERKLMVVVHPLSGVVHPTAFDLETGRLCVMASRHRAGMVVVSRDHVPHTLETHIPSAEQAVGRPDVTGRGHEQHLGFWGAMADADAVVEAAP